MAQRKAKKVAKSVDEKVVDGEQMIGASHLVVTCIIIAWFIFEWGKENW
ncbi:hypothetical protein ABID23_001278 [Bartonella silvatica]|uniref:Uncharacterized protein n=1 Tax=Bartonella silvatica TaxID=357760 RepID=A0ABV2HIG5_9HYPH